MDAVTLIRQAQDAGLAVEAVRPHLARHTLDYIRRLVPYCQRTADRNPTGQMLSGLKSEVEWVIPTLKGQQSDEQKAQARLQARSARYAVMRDYATEDQWAVITRRYSTVGELAADDPLSSNDELFGAPADALHALVAHLNETSPAPASP